MSVVNILEAKTQLSKLVDAVESGSVSRVVIARNGRPVAQLVALDSPKVRLGVRPDLQIPDDIDVDNAEIAAEFGVG